ncbi:hypothetical protein [Cytobacillus dafuensis]|uniref:hypothetical protein n=1 Tax=Cytobacillus dafuensis TaxID=1742359 RepID=UPI00070E169D|nr:hypothetical protein [Cytobacillus dafuensis]
MSYKDIDQISVLIAKLEAELNAIQDVRQKLEAELVAELEAKLEAEQKAELEAKQEAEVEAKQEAEVEAKQDSESEQRIKIDIDVRNGNSSIED